MVKERGGPMETPGGIAASKGKLFDPISLALRTAAAVNAFRPKRAPGFPVDLMNVDPYRLGEEDDATIARWTHHREAVTKVEGDNAAKLLTLLRSVGVLHRSGKTGDETAASAAEDLLKQTLAMFPRYLDTLRGKPPDFGEAALRRHSEQATRDFTSLPTEWRALRVVRRQKRRFGRDER